MRRRYGLGKKLLGVLDDGTRVYQVNGGYIRNKFDYDFLLGGHGYIYPQFIPRDEIWVEYNADWRDEYAIIAHEITEYRLMRYKHWSYKRAHAYACRIEYAVRHGRGRTPERIRR
jgi:hypothetical protein